MTRVSKPILRILFSAFLGFHLLSHPLPRLDVVKEPDDDKIMKLKEMSATGILKNICFRC